MDRLTDIESQLVTEADESLVGVIVEYVEFADVESEFGLAEVIGLVDEAAAGVGWLTRRPEPTALGGARWVAAEIDARRHVAAAPLAAGGGAIDAFLADVVASPFPVERPRWDVWIVEGLGDGRAGIAVRYDLSVAPDVAHLPLASVLFGAGVWPLLPDSVDDSAVGGGGMGDVGSVAQMLTEALSSPAGIGRLLGSIADLVETVVDRVVGEPEPEAAPPEVSCELGALSGGDIAEVAGAIVGAAGPGRARLVGGAAEGLSLTALARESAPDQRERVRIVVDTIVGPDRLLGRPLAGLWVAGPLLGAGTDTVTVTSTGGRICMAQMAGGVGSGSHIGPIIDVLADARADAPADASPEAPADVPAAPVKKRAAKKKAPVKKRAAKKKAPVKKRAAKKKAPVKKRAAKKKAPVKKRAAKKKAPVKKRAAKKKAPVKKRAAKKKAPAKKAPVKKRAAKKKAAKKKAPVKKRAAKKKAPVKKRAAKKKAPAKKAPARVKAPPARKQAPRRR